MTFSDLDWPTDEPRTRTEWDFRARWKGCNERQFDFLLPEEVWLCHCYEFDRTLPRTVEAVVERWRGKNKGANFEALLDHYWRTDGNGKEGHQIVSNWFYMIWPEWPQKPYLSISSAERNRRFNVMWPKSTLKPRTLQLLPLGEVAQAHVDLSKCGEIVRHAFQSFRGERTSFNGQTFTVWRKGQQGEQEYPQVVAAFKIDFALSPTRNAKLFENWCREHQAKNKWKARPNRGQTSDTDKLRSELNYLGAWRLVRSGLSYQGAANFTRVKSGQPLFADKAEWSRAVKRANGLLENYS